MDIAMAVSDQGRHGLRPRTVQLFAGLLAMAAATAVAVSVAIAGAAEHPVAVAVARGLSVAIPCGAGLFAWYRRTGERFGLALLATGALVFVTTLSESQDPVPYTIGRGAGWFLEVALVFLVLSYPSGRLPGRVDRLLVAAVAGIVLVTFLPRLFLAEQFSLPSPYTSCVSACPDNALFVVGSEPELVDSILTAAGFIGVAVVMVAVVVRLWKRLVRATPLARSMFGPVLAIAITRVALLAAGISVRDADGSVAGLEVVAWLLALLVPALALAFLLGLVRWRLFAGRALLRLAECLPVRDTATLERAFAEAFRDPGIQIGFRAAGPSGDRWCDALGRELAAPAAGSGRALTEISDGERPIAALIHDETLSLEPAMLRAGTSIAGTALVSRQLAAEADAAMHEVRRSRARIAASAERERRRIERDLHDGAQQRLVALRIELELAEEVIRRDPEQGARRVHDLEGRLDEAIDEVRSLAHGIYPPVLADRGIEEALRVVARRSAVPVTVTTREVGRYPDVVESAVYFCVLEALQNALKHAAGVHRIQVALDGQAGRLAFTVSDDGAGMAAGWQAGRGLANMRERAATLGGTISIGRLPAGGTVLSGSVPTSAPPA